MRRLQIIAVTFAILTVGKALYAATSEEIQRAIAEAKEELRPNLPPIRPAATEEDRYPEPGLKPVLPDWPLLKPLTEDALEAGAQPTPWPAVSSMLNAAGLQGDKRLYDPGCGPGARVLISAVRFFPQWTGNAVGVEIVPEYAEAARQAVAEAGYADRIEIITGDSTKMNIKADVVIAYMWPEFLQAFRPQIEKTPLFISYGFKVPGLSPIRTKQVALGSRNYGIYYMYSQPQRVAAAAVQVPITKTTRQTVRLPQGSYCTVCGKHCSNPMAHKLQQQIVGYRTVPAASPQVQSVPARSGHWETRCSTNWLGRKTCSKVWVED